MYVDKSRLIVEMLDRPGSKALLLPRPRRFGKTLALSMLWYYFERPCARGVEQVPPPGYGRAYDHAHR